MIMITCVRIISAMESISLFNSKTKDPELNHDILQPKEFNPTCEQGIELNARTNL